MRYFGALGNSVVQQIQQTLGMRIFHDALVVWIFGYDARIQLHHGRFQRLHKLSSQSTWHENVIRRHANLTRVGQLRPGNFFGRGLHGRRFVYDRRRFSSQFERNAARMLGRGAHDNLANLRRPREVHVIEGQGQQMRGRLDASLHHRHLIDRKNGRNNFGHHLGGLPGQFRWFEHDRAARGNGSDQWTEHQLHGIIPRSNDQRHSFRLWPDPRS